MMAFNLFGPNEIHIHYPLEKEKWMTVNEQLISQISIWQHYKEKHEGYINDKIILELAKQLDKTNYPIKSQGNLADKRIWATFEYNKFYLDKKAYKLVWYLEESKEILWIIHCQRRQQHDKK